jgi:hypothetical protein
VIEMFSPVAIEQLRTAVGGVPGGFTPLDLTPLVQAIRQVGTTMDKVLNRLENPTRTAGDEFTRRANLALTSEWFPDAVRDAEESVRIYPYRGTPRLIGAIAQMWLGQWSDAVRLLDEGIRYGAADEFSEIASMSLLGYWVAKVGGNQTLAAQFLASGNNKTHETCPAVIIEQINETASVGEYGHRLANLLRSDPGAFLDLDIPATVRSSSDWQELAADCLSFVTDLVEVTEAADRFRLAFNLDNERGFSGAGLLGPWCHLVRSELEPRPLPEILLRLRAIAKCLLVRRTDINTDNAQAAFAAVARSAQTLELDPVKLAQAKPINVLDDLNSARNEAVKLDVILIRAIDSQRGFANLEKWEYQAEPSKPRRTPFADPGNHRVALDHYETEKRHADHHNARLTALRSIKARSVVPDAERLSASLQTWAQATAPTVKQVVRPIAALPSLRAIGSI